MVVAIGLLKPKVVELSSRVELEENPAINVVEAAGINADEVDELLTVENPVVEPTTDAETAPIPPKQPVATPAQKYITVPQTCPNLQDHVSPL